MPEPAPLSDFIAKFSTSVQLHVELIHELSRWSTQRSPGWRQIRKVRARVAREIKDFTRMMSYGIARSDQLVSESEKGLQARAYDVAVELQEWLMRGVHFLSPGESGHRHDIRFSLARPQDLLAAWSQAGAVLAIKLDAIERLKATPPATATHEPTNEAERAIRDALREHGERMTGESLAQKALGKYDGHAKATLSSMKKRGILTNEKASDPPGYGLPEWDGSKS